MCDNHQAERVHDGDHKRRIYRGFRFDANRYQALLDHYRTSNGPLKTVTGPVGPVNEHNLDDIVKSMSVEKKKQDLPKNAETGPDSDHENQPGADSDNNDTEPQRPGLIAVRSGQIWK